MGKKGERPQKKGGVIVKFDCLSSQKDVNENSGITRLSALPFSTIQPITNRLEYPPRSELCCGHNRHDRIHNQGGKNRCH